MYFTLAYVYEQFKKFNDTFGKSKQLSNLRRIYVTPAKFHMPPGLRQLFYDMGSDEILEIDRTANSLQCFRHAFFKQRVTTLKPSRMRESIRFYEKTWRKASKVYNAKKM